MSVAHNLGCYVQLLSLPLPRHCLSLSFPFKPCTFLYFRSSATSSDIISEVRRSKLTCKVFEPNTGVDLKEMTSTCGALIMSLFDAEIKVTHSSFNIFMAVCNLLRSKTMLMAILKSFRFVLLGATSRFVWSLRCSAPFVDQMSNLIYSYSVFNHCHIWDTDLNGIKR